MWARHINRPLNKHVRLVLSVAAGARRCAAKPSCGLVITSGQHHGRVAPQAGNSRAVAMAVNGERMLESPASWLRSSAG